MKRSPRGVLLAVAVGLAVPLAACTDGGSSDAAAGSSPVPTATGGTHPSPSAATVAAGQPVGAGCAQLPASGPGSLEDVAGLPAAQAAGRTPQLSTLVQALTAATLIDTLNSTENITVLAPSNAAFQALPADSLKQLVADVPRLTAVLTHHVIPGRRTPAQLTGRLTTLDNDSITVSGAGQDLTISGDQTLTGQPAHVVCGNIPTANATVYVIDQVLKPQHLG